MRRRRWAVALAAVGLFAAVVYGRDVAAVLSPPADLAWPEGWRAEVALVPSGDPGIRTVRAVELFEAGVVDRILISGAGYGGDSAAWLANIARNAGVPEDRILLETRATSTWENAAHSAPLVRRLGARRLIVVTSARHAARAGLSVRAALPGVAVRAEPVPELRTGAGMVLAEAARLTLYRILGRIPVF